jgi:putative addiction module component (TIGR02574 family)
MACAVPAQYPEDLGDWSCPMNAKLQGLPLDERIKLVEDLWDSIAADQKALPLTPAQRAELDKRLDSYELDRNAGRLVSEVLADTRKRI